MTDVEVFENYESEVRSYCRSFPAVFTTSKGSIMKDENGKEYIDFFCGAGALNYGHNNDYIKEKMVAYLMSDGIMHSMDMMTVPKKEFLQFFEEKVLQPRGLNFKVMFPGPTGTNGVEAALKLARKVKKRNQIWALMGAALVFRKRARWRPGSSLVGARACGAPTRLQTALRQIKRPAHSEERRGVCSSGGNRRSYFLTGMISSSATAA